MSKPCWPEQAPIAMLCAGILPKFPKQWAEGKETTWERDPTPATARRERIQRDHQGPLKFREENAGSPTLKSSTALYKVDLPINPSLAEAQSSRRKRKQVLSGEVGSPTTSSLEATPKKEFILPTVPGFSLAHPWAAEHCLTLYNNYWNKCLCIPRHSS